MVFDIATLDGLAADIGAPVPHGDPGALFALADQLEASARAWQDHADALARLRARLRSVLVGDTGDAHDQHLAQLLLGPDSLQGDTEALRAGVAALRNYGADLQDNQWTSRMLAAWLLATMIWGAASVIATGGESLLEVAVARVRTAAAINALKEMLWRRIAAILTELLVNAGRAVLVGGAQQLVVQGIQVARGDRTGLNGQLVAGTGLSFAEFGVGAAAAEHGVLGLVADAAKDSPAASVAAWATSKGLSGMAGNTVATLAGGGPITPETLWTGAAMGGASALADARGKGASGRSVPEPTENAVPANAIDTHPTLRFERQPDGTFAWPGETTNDAGQQAHTALAPTTITEPAVAAGEHGPGAAPHALPAAADPGARSMERTSNTPPAAADAGHLPATSVAAGLDAAHAAPASVGSHPPESTLDTSVIPPATSTEPLTATASPTVSLAPLESNAASPATPTVPNAAAPAPWAPTMPSAAGPRAPAPTSAPTSSSAYGPNAGLSSPTPDLQAGPVDTSPAGKSSSQPAGVRAAGRVDTTATHSEANMQDTTGAEHVTASHAAGADRAAPAVRSEAGSHAVDRGNSTAADRQQRPADPLTKRQDPSTRANVNRHDPSTGPRGRPGKLRSGIARDTGDLQPATTARAPGLVAAAEDIGAIKASHGDSGPDTGKPQSHKGDRDGSDGDNTPNPSTASGGTGDHRGGDGGYHGGAGGSVIEPGDGGESDDEDSADAVGFGRRDGRHGVDDGLDGGDAIAFERELGDRLFHDHRAAVAARRTVERLFDVMRVLHTELHPGTMPERTEQIFFSDDPANPGQVGRGVVTLPELVREGNLRMVMASLLNAYEDSKDLITATETIRELLNRPGWEGIAVRAGLDVPRLRALKEMTDAGHDIRTMHALASHSPDTRDTRDTLTEYVASQAARWQRTPADREAYRRTSREFADRGIALHPLEIAAQRSTGPCDVFEAPPTAQDWSQQIASAEQGAKPAAPPQPADDPEAPLHWLSGRAVFGLDTKSPWFRAVAVERGFPVTAGISGTAARLHSIFIWIRPQGVTEHEFARALIGRMLPSEHHSLYEIIRGIEVASPHLFHGPGDGFADVSDLHRRAPWEPSHDNNTPGRSSDLAAGGLGYGRGEGRDEGGGGRGAGGVGDGGREESLAADRQRRPADPVTKLQDPSTRHDAGTGSRRRPDNLAPAALPATFPKTCSPPPLAPQTHWQLAVQAIAADDPTTAADLLDAAPPVAATPDEATVAGCIGTGLSLLDTWLSGHHLDTPTDLAANIHLPAGRWDGEHAATDIITNARKHRAFDTQNAIILRHGGRNVHYGTALALTAALHTWATLTDQHIDNLARLHIT